MLLSLEFNTKFLHVYIASPMEFSKNVLAFGDLQQDCLFPSSNVSQKIFFCVILLAREIHLKVNMPHREICHL